MSLRQLSEKQPSGLERMNRIESKSSHKSSHKSNTIGLIRRSKVTDIRNKEILDPKQTFPNSEKKKKKMKKKKK
jgi:hypothetical protein